MSRKKHKHRNPLWMEVVLRDADGVHVIMDDGQRLLGHPPMPERDWLEIQQHPSASWFQIIDHS